MALPNRLKKQAPATTEETFRPATEDGIDETVQTEPTPEELAAASAPVEEEAPPAPEKPAPKAKAEAKPAPAPAVQQQAGAVEVSTGPKQKTLMELKKEMDPNIFKNMFPSVTGSNGALRISQAKIDFGTWLDIQVLSWHDRWFVVPIAPEGDKDSNKYCRASYDGETIPGRGENPTMSIDEYQEAISDKYPETKINEYIDIYALVVGAEKGAAKGIEIGIVQVQVSPTSRDQFLPFAMQAPLTVSRGQMLASHQNFMRVVADPQQTDQGKDYVRTLFNPVPIDIVKTYTHVDLKM